MAHDVEIALEGKNDGELVEGIERLEAQLRMVPGPTTPIFFASGQAQILQPMAISLGFGLARATLLNLICVPLFYSVVYRIK